MTPIERAYYLGIQRYIEWRQILTTYLTASGVRKLQLGAGSTPLDGWLSTDIAPESNRVMYLDATKPFPLDDDMFDYVHSEHMIEHITWHEGLFMLRECRRILRPGGTVRIATPDLKVLVGLYLRDKDPMNKKYVQWATDTFLAGTTIYKASFVINNAFRNWGHQFLYDGELMEMAMREAGFKNIRRCSMGESEDENLRGIESHGKTAGNEEIIAFETMVFEGD